ncbi:MAG: SelB C-terminal domain-containing protein, partial [Candidatus Dormibacteraceae bacterium]
HYVLTDPASGSVLGGGVFADVRPRRRPRGSEGLIDSLVQRLAGDGPAQELERHPFGISRKELLKVTGGSDADLDNLDAQHVGSSLFNPAVWARLRTSMLGQVETYHRAHPLRMGVPAQELCSRLHIPPGAFRPVLDELVSAGDLIEQAGLLRIPSYQVEVDAAATDALIEALSVPSPPLLSAALKGLGLQSDIAEAVIARGSLVRIGRDLVIGRPQLDAAVALVRSEIGRHGSISLSRLRDLTQGSRRSAQAILEQLDGVGETRRIGDQHVRGPASRVE